MTEINANHTFQIPDSPQAEPAVAHEATPDELYDAAMQHATSQYEIDPNAIDITRLEYPNRARSVAVGAGTIGAAMEVTAISGAYDPSNPEHLLAVSAHVVALRQSISGQGE